MSNLFIRIIQNPILHRHLDRVASKTGIDFIDIKLVSESLKKALNQDGKHFTTIPLPMPSTIKHKGFRLPASYANFYIGNQTVLVPAFNDPSDDIAEDILKKCFPSRNRFCM